VLLNHRSSPDPIYYSLYQRYGTYGEVARRTKLDRRAVKKYITDYRQQTQEDKRPIKS
jgi:hypothetical protein